MRKHRFTVCSRHERGNDGRKSYYGKRAETAASLLLVLIVLAVRKLPHDEHERDGGNAGRDNDNALGCHLYSPFRDRTSTTDTPSNNGECSFSEKGSLTLPLS